MSVVLVIGAMILCLSGLVSINGVVEWKGAVIIGTTGVIMAGISTQGLQFANGFHIWKVRGGQLGMLGMVCALKSLANHRPGLLVE